MLEDITQQIAKTLSKGGIAGKIELTTPPNPEMGDLALPCFELAKIYRKSPGEVAKDIANQVTGYRLQVIEKAQAVGPYVNFFLQGPAVAKMVLKGVKKAGERFGANKIGQGQRVMVEFAHPNTHKAFHIGHLRNLITGESIVRLLENAGYKVIRANYQGDVGLHIAKCLWAILETGGLKTVEDKVRFLGKAYAQGATAFDKDEKTKEEIIALNKKIYQRDPGILELYETTRQWSLAYFDAIYKRVGSHFDRLYFESEVFARGKEIVLKFLPKGVFKASQGAIIFAGSKYGLHDRVFVNSEGFPTYEAKDVALAELQFKEYRPDKIIHVVAREQSDYFKVLFRSLEEVLPKSQGKECHLIYGWVSLKEGKMSSRTGQVVLAGWLLDEVEKEIGQIMKDHPVANADEVRRKVTLAAAKYAFLKTKVDNDIVFDLRQSISLHGDSGPYLLYIVARIKSILRKSEINSKSKIPNIVETVEKQLLLHLARFPEITKVAAERLDPSEVAQYLFDLAQCFNAFYDNCPVLQADEPVRAFRLQLIQAVAQVMERGLYLLGMETVEEM